MNEEMKVAMNFVKEAEKNIGALYHILILLMKYGKSIDEIPSKI